MHRLPIGTGWKSRGSQAVHTALLNVTAAVWVEVVYETSLLAGVV
jgi:hypothetical protein